MKIVALYHHYASRAAALLGAACLLSVFCYGAFLLLAVSHAAALRTIDDKRVELESRLSVLQADYLSRTRSLTPEYARALGFVEPLSRVTVTASVAGLSLTAPVLERP